MSDHLVRIGNLKAIAKANGWNDSELGRRCGRSPQQVAAWVKGTRKIGERLARMLEDRLELGRYALDERASIPTTREPAPGWGSSAHPARSITRRSKELPLIRWADVAVMLNAENETLKSKAPHFETFSSSSSRAKFVEMPDDSMTPEFNAGNHLLFDPSEAPRAGDVVLVGLPTGERFVRMFRPRTALAFEAVPMNPHYQAVSSQADDAAVLAVMIEHRRYRRAA